jgi:iron complex transport system permease protein
VITGKERRGRLCLALFAAIFLIVVMMSFGIGRFPVSPLELIRVFFGKLTNSAQTWSDEVELVIFKIRMPRVFAGAMVGAGLSASGAAYQGLFRNPLVSPDVLGASAGAGFGASLAILLGFNYAIVSASAFLFGMMAVGTAYLISTSARRNTTLGMVLAGIMISSLFTSGTSFVKLIADPTNILPSITFWLMGSISGVHEDRLIWAAIPILGGMLVLFILRWKLNLLSTGEDEARSMGVNIKVMRFLVVLAATIIASACVAISGLIGWVGLVIPHFARMIVGYDYRVMMPVSMFMGASFMMLVDILARSITTAEIPLGILTAFVGAPFFLYLILDRGNRM